MVRRAAEVLGDPQIMFMEVQRCCRATGRAPAWGYKSVAGLVAASASSDVGELFGFLFSGSLGYFGI